YEVIQPMPKTLLKIEPNGSYSGMIGHIINKEADMSAFPQYMSIDVFHLIDYTSIIRVLPIKFVIKQRKSKPNWETIFRPFTFEVWLLLLMSFVLTGIVLSQIIKKANNLHEWKEYWTMKKIIWFLFSTITYQGFNLDYAIRVSLRIIIGVWLITVLVLGYGYSGVLISFLTAPNYERIPRNFDELASAVESGDFSCGTSNFAKDLYFKGNKSAISKTLGDHINQKSNYLNVEDTAEKISNGRFAYIENIEYINSVTRKDLSGKIITSEDQLISYPVAYLLRKDFPLRCLFESGITEFLRSKEEGNKSAISKTLGDHINQKSNYLNVEDTAEKISNGRFAYIENIEYINSVTRKDLSGKIITSEDQLISYPVAYLLRKDFPYKKHVNSYIDPKESI
ncbi:glutamate receptor ionotropic, kainate 5-like, partial [Centruroides sculpturatus]|uniref:glutamate receptor ionotropic, kainate 5-like n=1 Tax=Centruroides sculpturatus TaxID=218467 RepID=UPI000C6E7BBA